jgi:hypothetical protein
MSFKAEVQTDSTGKWYGNGCRYPSEQAAQQAGASLAARWTLVHDMRVVESDDPANYDIVDGRVVSLDPPPPPAPSAAEVLALLAQDVARLGGVRRSRARRRQDNDRGV